MKKLILIFCALGMAVSSWGYDFGGTDGIVYNITSSKAPYTVGVTSFISSGTYCGSVVIPSSVTYKNITYSVTSIDSLYCSQMLKAITIPSTVTTIKNQAFSSCTLLANIYVNQASPMDLSNSLNAFSGVSLTSCILHVPKGSLTAYQEAIVWKGFTNITDDISTSAVTYATASAVKVSVRNGQAVITGTEAGTALSVYNLQGTAIYSGKTRGETESISLPGRGVYIVLLGGKSVKVIY